MNRLFGLASPFGEAFHFKRLSGREAVPQVFEFERAGSVVDTRVDARIVGRLCERWRQARALGTHDRGCGGVETRDVGQPPVPGIVIA